MTSSYPLPSIAGLDTGATWPTASEYFKYVSIDATTMRASTVIKSIPTSETRTHASITIPLSNTRSRTSIRLVPPAARSTGIGTLLVSGPSSLAGHRRLLQRCSRGPTPRERRQLPLETPHLLFQLFVLGRQRLFARREVVVELPPVEADLFRLVDRTDEQSDPNCQELDFGQRHFDVARHHQSLVENAIENVDETGGSSMSLSEWCRHRF